MGGPGLDALREARVGRVGAVTVYSDANLGKDASDDAKGGVFAKESIVQVHFMGGPRMEIIPAAARIQGGGFTLDMQVGHYFEQKPMTSGSTGLEGAAAIKP